MLTIKVIVETPKGSAGKFDRDPKTGMMMLNKIMPKGLVFPFDFGFVPDTIGGDGDPIDIVVISEMGTFSGCSLQCRVIGAIKASQREKNGAEMRNDRVLVVPMVSRDYAAVKEIKDLPKSILRELETFFRTYNEQAGKKFDPIAEVGSKAAMALIEKGRVANDKKSWLIQLFLPAASPAQNVYNKKLSQLKTELTKHFGGLTVYAQAPVEGKWLNNKQTITEKMLVFEVMAGEIEVTYLERLKEKLEKKFEQKEVLIRSQQIGII